MRGSFSAKPASRNLVCEQWMQDKLCIVSGCSHPVAKQACSSHILSEQLWVFDHESSLSHIRAVQLLKSLNVYVRNDICMSTIGAIKRAIGTGIGLSVLPYVAIKEELERGELCLIDLKGWDYKRTYWSIQRESDELSLQSNIFLNFLNNAS